MHPFDISSKKMFDARLLYCEVISILLFQSRDLTIISLSIKHIHYRTIKSIVNKIIVLFKLKENNIIY